MTDTGHARFGPSGAHRYMRCTGSVALEARCPAQTSNFAEEGTAAHEVLEWALTDKAHVADAYLGRITSNGWDVTQEMCDNVQITVNNVFGRIEQFKLLGEVTNVELHVENKLDISSVLGIGEQFGTADIIIIVEYSNRGALMSVEDFKYGAGVQVFAEDNEQAQLYALGAYEEYRMAFDFDEIIVAIHQPRYRGGWLDEWSLVPEELLAFGREAANEAQVANQGVNMLSAGSITVKDLELTPGEKQCQWCRAKGICPALASEVFESTTTTFTNLDDLEDNVEHGVKEGLEELDSGVVTIKKLGEYMASAKLIEDWLKAVRARVEAELLFGNGVPGFKLIKGRRGSKAWIDADDVEIIMKRMSIPERERYKRSLITPTVAEKLLKDRNPRKWKKLLEEITQSDGKPSVAPESHKSPAIVIEREADFADLDAEDDFSDLA